MKYITAVICLLTWPFLIHAQLSNEEKVLALLDAFQYR